MRDNVRHKKDFEWRERKQNPFRKETINWKKRIELSVLVCSVLTTAGLLVYHPFFSVQHIEVHGLQRIDEKEFVDAVQGITDYRKIFFFPGKNYFFVHTDEIHDILLDRFPVTSLVVEKIFPDHINIMVEEKISTIIYDNGKQYSYLGLDGNIVEIIRNVGSNEWKTTTRTTTSTGEFGKEKKEEVIVGKVHTPLVKTVVEEMGDYPIVYDNRGKEGGINTVVLKKELVEGIIDWFNFLTKKTDIPFSYILIENELGEGIIYTAEGSALYVRFDKKTEQQFTSLLTVLKERGNRNGLQYIDLRFAGRVYIK